MPYIHCKNIGYLLNENDLIRGDVPVDFVKRIYGFIQKPFGTKGFEACLICHPDRNLVSFVREPKVFDSQFGPHQSIESSDILVTAADGVNYRATRLIVHLVIEHNYKPEQGFIDAVLKVQPRHWNEWSGIN